MTGFPGRRVDWNLAGMIAMAPSSFTLNMVWKKSGSTIARCFGQRGSGGYLIAGQIIGARWSDDQYNGAIVA